MTVRVIPRLDIKGPNLVKGIHLEGLRVLGKPERFARHYYEDGADELLYVDAVASLYGRNSLDDIIERTAREIFIPLCVGGGLRTVDDISRVLRAGADKVSLNTAAVARPELVSEAARKFGSSTIVVSIETIREGDGTWRCFTDNGREATGLDALAWAIRVAELGAGELIVTSVDREGTGTGFDVEITRAIAAAVPIPVIACGGAGGVEHVGDVVAEAGADAIAVASILHYRRARLEQQDVDDFRGEGNIEFMKQGRGFSRIRDATIPEIKAHLAEKGFPCRP